MKRFTIYFKQAMQMLRQNVFISIIAILGTAVAIMMIMAIIVSEEIKTVDIAPEINRSRTLYIDQVHMHDSVNGRKMTGSPTYQIVYEYLYKLQKPQYISAVSTYRENDSAVASLEGSMDHVNIALRITDPNYWKILEFIFLQGRPFNEEEFQSGIEYAVISESTAKKIFKDEDALGKTIDLNFKPHRIIGVVKDVSPLYSYAYGDVWVPATSNKIYNDEGYDIMLMGKSDKDFPEIIAEVRDCERQYGIEKSPWAIYLKGPENRKLNTMGLSGRSESQLKDEIKIQTRKRIFILVILLLIPAVNLSGLSTSRIKKRTTEIGVRKAFGAKKYIILIQVLYENFITSLMGGLLGLILSYVVVFQMRRWLLGIPVGSSIPIGTLVSPYIFLAVFVACLIINLISAGIPAIRASRINIIDSINQNEKRS